MEEDDQQQRQQEAAAAVVESKSSGVMEALASFYSKYLLNAVAALLSSSNSLSNIFRRTPRRRRRPCLPPPLHSTFSPDTSRVATEVSGVYDVLEDVAQTIFDNLHYIQKNLQFWQTKAEGSYSQKIYFMIFERGPWAFIDGTIQFLHHSIHEGSSIQHLIQYATAHISKRIVVLHTLRSALAVFLAELYTEIERSSEESVKNPKMSMCRLVVTINDLFMKLEASMRCLHGLQQTDSSVDGSYLVPLSFKKQIITDEEGIQLTDSEISEAITIVYENLENLNIFLSSVVSKQRKPRKVTRCWIRYSCGAVGLTVCSMWLLRHSRLMGSSDIDNWIRGAKDSTIAFFNDHVEQPLLSIRDELFETFRKRHKGVMDVEEVQLTENSLHRMLLAFSEGTKGQKFPENASDQEMLEIVMERYEKELMHPIQNLLGGELARALLIQVQKLKLDIETAMLELDQILKANEINFAILAALPAFFLFLLLLMLVRAWFGRDTKAEGRGRIARRQRRLILVEVEERIMQCQVYIDQGLVKDSQCTFGLVLYSLDRLFHVVERHARATGEWQWLRKDIIDLAKPSLQTAYKLTITSRMERVYECMLPSLKRQ